MLLVNPVCKQTGPPAFVTTPRLPSADSRPAASKTLEKIPTPGIRTIDDLCKLLDVPASQTIKTLIVDGDDSPIALILRGDHELKAVKAQNLDGVAIPLTMATTETIQAATGSEPGSLGPVGLKLPVFIDHAVAAMADFSCGANVVE